MSNEWCCLYEIEDWRDKDLERAYAGMVIDYPKGTVVYMYPVVGKFFDKPVWREKTAGLPTYEEWDKNRLKITGLSCACGRHVELEESLYLVEKIRRYIDHLAEIVNGDWEPNWNDDTSRHYIFYHHHDLELKIGSMYNSVSLDWYFKSEEAAERVIKVAEHELKIAFGVQDE